MSVEQKRDDALFLGLDSSTQSLKATVVDANLTVVYETAVSFDRDLSEFNTDGGVHRSEGGLRVTSPVLMWVKALDMVMDRMKSEGCPCERIVAVSGSGQQHGSVWFREGARKQLNGLSAEASLSAQLSDSFSIMDSPVWMDSSTTAQCREREQALGGAQAVADLTGSRAYERFTGNQIARIYQQQPDKYRQTERICLVSSFVASLMLGDYAAIDAGDGSGMNLMDIRTKQWSQDALDCTAPDLASKLGAIVPSHQSLGTVHKRYVERYGFNAECLVTAFSGDNPNSLCGLRLQNPGDIAVSLGTSDTVFGFLSDPRPSATEGHIFANPVAPDAYMALICYKNGSLTREFVRDEFTAGSWDTFGESLSQTPIGNKGRIGFYFKEPEITPPILKTGIFRFDADDRPVAEFTSVAEARAVVEGQFLSMRLHGKNVGLKPTNILATGGASVNRRLLKVMADVFGAPVYISDKSDSASLGAAYRALHGWKCSVAGSFIPFTEVFESAPPFARAFDPDRNAHAVYTEMLARYAALEARVAE